jgi:hypothetical protein
MSHREKLFVACTVLQCSVKDDMAFLPEHAIFESLPPVIVYIPSPIDMKF